MSLSNATAEWALAQEQQAMSQECELVDHCIVGGVIVVIYQSRSTIGDGTMVSNRIAAYHLHGRQIFSAIVDSSVQGDDHAA